MSPLRTALSDAVERLRTAGVATADHDARALAAASLGLPHLADLDAVDELDGARARFEDLVAQRAARVPLQHLLGSTRFRALELLCGPGVFVPQPETESLVAWVVAAAPAERWGSPLVVDLCSGSGTLALSLAHELPAARVHAVERSEEAAAWLTRNAANRLAAGDPPTTVHCDDAAHALPELDGTVDLVVANPPYVAEHEGAAVDPEVLHHDPAVALFAGHDGLDLVRTVERTAARLLRPGGLVVVEHSDRQGTTAPAVFTATGAWDEVRDHRDAEGRDRFLTARRLAP